jgi:hypothetical protein
MMNLFLFLIPSMYKIHTTAQVNKHHRLSETMNQRLMSLRSDSGGNSRLTIILIDGGMKVVQESDSTSEMFAIKLNLFDLHWHQIAFR